MPKDTMDRRVRRTRTVLAQTAEALLDEGRWTEASVQEICQRADLARSSFYAHFACKEGLLTWMLEEKLAASDDEIAAIPDRHGRLVTLTWLVWHIRSARPLYRHLLSDAGPVGLRRRHEVRLRTALSREIGRSVQGRGPEPLRFMAAGALAVVEDWLARDKGLGTADVEERLHALVSPALAVA
ncbi:TetR/AcrR family transcriptional regulator [Pelagovum pacificum]|nr:TetR/AcrR family transcriptional regulator [Pelagovum pacificum]QQA44028.1 TetR/AcrR family transcriptional regulator [Pelagovum pacificum]